MFDTIYCEYPLPQMYDEDLQDNLSVVESPRVLQTKNLERGLYEYRITDKGRLIQLNKKYVWDEDTRKHSLIKGKFKCIDMFEKEILQDKDIIMYEFLAGDKYDFFIEYKVRFYSGNVLDIEFFNFEKKSSAPRLARSAEMNEQFKALDRVRSSWWYGIYSLFWRYPVGFVTSIICKIGRKLSKADKIKDFLVRF